MDKEQLVDRMKVVLASSFAFMLKAWNYHWNVEGINFPQYHTFFGNLYEEVQDAIDPIAEHIRTLDAYAPGSLERFKQLSSVLDETTVPAPAIMALRLEQDNDKLIQDLTFASTEAERIKEVGLVDFLQGRIDIHKKHRWMLKAIQK